MKLPYLLQSEPAEVRMNRIPRIARSRAPVPWRPVLAGVRYDDLHGEQEFVHVRFVVLFQSHPHGAENQIGDLVFPEHELYVIPGVGCGRSELKQLLCSVLLLRERRLLLFRQMRRVLLSSSSDGDDVVR